MSDDETVLNACLDLFRRLPPQNVEANLARVCELVPELADELQSSVDVPLKLLQDGSTGKQYLGCDYNRDGDSYRSPWDNEYYPPLAPEDAAEAAKPSDKLRKLESRMNSAFAVYRDLYYEGGTSSVYLWDLDDTWAGAVLVKKVIDDGKSKASWDSIHVFDALERGRTAHYKLTSTILLSMETVGSDKVTLAGSITRQNETDAPFDSSNESAHVTNVGRLVEDMENRMRNTLSEIYFSKTRDITNSLRSSKGFAETKKERDLQGELVGLLQRKQQKTASS